MVVPESRTLLIHAPSSQPRPRPALSASSSHILFFKTEVKLNALWRFELGAKISPSSPAGAMSANDIIFNAPALNSLKRAQLVQLCKSHDLKTTGKNNELVNRLQEYAQVMSTDGLLTVFEGSENRPSTDDSHENGVDTQRSNQSLDYITELTEESSRNGSANSKKSVASSGSAGEFGTSTSKCAYLVIKNVFFVLTPVQPRCSRLSQARLA